MEFGIKEDIPLVNNEMKIWESTASDTYSMQVTMYNSF